MAPWRNRLHTFFGASRIKKKAIEIFTSTTPSIMQMELKKFHLKNVCLSPIETQALCLPSP